MFRVWRGTGTATLEAKILQEDTGMGKEVLYEIFVDINKANDVLKQWNALYIMEVYGVLPHV